MDIEIVHNSMAYMATGNMKARSKMIDVRSVRVVFGCSPS